MAALLFFAIIAAAQNSVTLLIGLPVTGIFLIYELWLLYRNLPLNHRQAEMEILPELGAGTWLTMLRGLFLALLGGFIVLPRPVGWLAWIPGLLYLLAAIADYLDGYAARRTNHATLLGQSMDMDFDALGILIAPLLAVLYGQLPIWYLLVSLSRYLFIAGSWLLKQQGKKLYTLLDSDARRFLAGFQMGLCAVVLLPIFTPPGTHIVATLFMIPFLAGFTRDWLATSGALNVASPHYKAWMFRLSQIVLGWLPLALRLMLIALWAVALATGNAGATSAPVLAVEGIALIAVAFGFITRLSSLIFLVTIGLALRGLPLDFLAKALMVVAALLALTGGGAYSAWSPDERFLRFHAGGEGHA